MAKMKWHQPGERRMEAGISDVALFVIDDNGDYEVGVAWNGVTNVNEASSGADVTDLYADNIKYASMRSAEKFGFSLDCYTYPDAWNECDGSKEAETGVYLGQQPRKAFGLVYKTNIGDENHPSMDKGYKLHIVWNSTASPTSRSYGTIGENPDAIVFSYEASSTPVEVTGHKPTCDIVIDSTKADADALAELLDMIYGTDGTGGAQGTDPEMPTPNEVLALFA